jgi:NhaA family Na+:H+ antiporter
VFDGIKRFFAAPTAGGIVLALATVAALIFSNSPWAHLYVAFDQIPGEVRIGGDWLVLAKPLQVWVNDLWMAVFFFLVGLEIKREFVHGELSRPAQAALPAVAALGGMALPALIYAAINWGDPVALRGWAIPAATDIAFAIGIVMLLGRGCRLAEGLPDRGGHHRRPGGDRGHRGLLHGPAVPGHAGAAAACLVLLALLNRAGCAGPISTS